VKIQDTLYFQRKQLRIATMRLGFEIEKIVKPILMPLIERINTLLLKYGSK
jgi:hypothetical protein